MDLTFCFQSQVILQEELKKIEYIGTYTVSNSKGAMSKMIGSQIYNKLQTFNEDASFRDVVGNPRLDDIIKGYIKDEFLCNIKSYIYPTTIDNYGFNYTYTLEIHIVGYLNIVIKFMSRK